MNGNNETNLIFNLGGRVGIPNDNPCPKRNPKPKVAGILPRYFARLFSVDTSATIDCTIGNKPPLEPQIVLARTNVGREFTQETRK